jgi:endonuclease VIII
MGARCVSPSDTVARLADRISERFAGERVQRCTTRHPGIADLDLTGQRLRGTDAVGRHLLLRFDDVAVHGQLRMAARWLAGPRATEPLWRRRLELRLDTGWLTALDMTVLDAVAPGDESEVIRHVGPDLCGRHPPDLDEVVERMASRPAQPLAGALLDRRNAVGFDDVYAVEVPFICGVSPFQPLGRSSVCTRWWLSAQRCCAPTPHRAPGTPRDVSTGHITGCTAAPVLRARSAGRTWPSLTNARHRGST